MPRFKDIPPTDGEQLPKRLSPAKPAHANPQLPSPSRSDSADATAAGPTLTRRGFAAATAATAAAAGVGALVVHNLRTPASDEPDPSAPVVVDPGAATNITEDFEQVEALRLAERARYDLPLGSVLNAAEGSWLPVILPGATADAISQVAAWNLDTGELKYLVGEPIVPGTNIVILDARCSDTVLAWTEVDIATRAWTLYASTWDPEAGSLTGDIRALWEADADWDPAYFCCAGNQVIWQVQPALSGTKTTEWSHLYRWRAGDSAADQLWESHGRFACEPSVSRDCVVIVPRVEGDGSGVYYGITALAKSDLTHVVDQLVMPQSVKPFRAARVGDQFAFSVEATYGSGGLLANMGYYVGTSTGDITWLSREPAAGVWGRDGVYAFKARASYLVYDSTEQEFSVLLASDRSVDYGEYPAATGDTDTFVTFATVKDATTGYPARVVARTFDLVSAEEAHAAVEPPEDEEAAGEAAEA